MEPSKDYNLTVGLRIREVREAFRMTRAAFSEKCDISESFLTAVERGDKSITSKTLFKICTGANITPNYIILGSEKGYEMDIILELFNGLDQKYQPLAVKLLSAYVEAVNMPK